MQVDFTLAKKKKEIWKSQGSQTISRETNTNSRTYKEYEVLTNKPLSKLVHLLVVRAKDFLEVIPIGRHLEAKMIVMGEYHLILVNFILKISFNRLVNQM